MRLPSLARNCLILLILGASLAPAPTRAQSLPAATPASVGMSGERLNRLSATLQQYVDQGRAAGLVTVVVRQGKVVHLEAFGKRDIEAGAPMPKDTIFRIASMSKAITSLATMNLLEEGKLLLNDPVS
jgi:CubicO group peptidase (beta-lactamase class C family)